jgi:4-amino-4-deoxy-L-arabinose transferase-like glycosyltransferase
MLRLLHSRRAELLGIALIASAAFLLPLLSGRDIVSSHEARLAGTAREMSDSGWPWDAAPVRVALPEFHWDESGSRAPSLSDGAMILVNPWIIPILGDELRLKKPPLPYWAAAVSFRLLGVSAATAILPSAVLGFLSVFIIRDLARQLLGRRAALLAPLVWVSTHFVVSEHTKAMADPYLAFFTLVSIWAWVRASANRVRGGWRDGAAGWLLLLYASLGLGLLVKGPVIFAHLIAAALAYHICYRVRPPRGWALHLLGACSAIAIALPWALYVWRNVPGAINLWQYESVGRFGEHGDRPRPFWYYLLALVPLTLPWTPVAAAAVALVWRRRGRRRRIALRPLFAWSWYTTTILIFSLVSTKKYAYLLPAMPAQTLLITQGLMGLIAAARGVKRGAAKVVAAAQMVIGLVAACIITALLLLPLLPFAAVRRLISIDEWSPSTLAPALVVAVAVLAVASGALPLQRAVRRRPQRLAVIQCLAYAVLICVMLLAIEPRRENRHSPRCFAAALAAAASEPGATLWTRNLPSALCFYLLMACAMRPATQASSWSPPWTAGSRDASVPPVSSLSRRWTSARVPASAGSGSIAPGAGA